MNWTRDIHLYIDLDAIGTGTNPLIKITGTSSTRAQTPQFVQGDAFPINLHFMRYDDETATYSSETLTDTSLIFAAKQTPEDTDLLFYVDEFPPNTDNYGVYYTGLLNLNTTKLVGETAIEYNTTGYATAKADIEIQNPDNTQRTTIQFDVRINQQRFNTTDVAPTTAEPPYPPPTSLLTRKAGTSPLAQSKTGTIDISTFALTTPPSLFPIIQKPDAAADSITVLSIFNVTTTSFAYELSATPTIEGYTLAYLLI